jgi:hypothetical protein
MLDAGVAVEFRVQIPSWTLRVTSYYVDVNALVEQSAEELDYESFRACRKVAN